MRCPQQLARLSTPSAMQQRISTVLSPRSHSQVGLSARSHGRTSVQHAVLRPSLHQDGSPVGAQRPSEAERVPACPDFVRLPRVVFHANIILTHMQGLCPQYLDPKATPPAARLPLPDGAAVGLLPFSTAMLPACFASPVPRMPLSPGARKTVTWSPTFHS